MNTRIAIIAFWGDRYRSIWTSPAGRMVPESSACVAGEPAAAWWGGAFFVASCLSSQFDLAGKTLRPYSE